MLTHRYSIRFLTGLVVPFLLLVVLLPGGCSEDSPVAEGDGGGGGNITPPPPPETIPDSALVTIRLVAWDDLTGQGTPNESPGEIDEVRFEISAPDITTHTRVVAVASEIIEQDFVVETGGARRIDVSAFNAADSLLYAGTKFTVFADSAQTTAVGMVKTTDDTPPVFAGADGGIAISDNHVLVSWPIATDGSDPDYKATYLIFMSTVTGSFNYSTPSFTSAPGETSFLAGDLDPGTPYYFVVRAMDRAGNITSNTAQQMITTSGATGALFVDVNTGINNTGCGTSGSPCRTITYALSKSVSDQTIHVAKGVYDAASGESFPLQLKSGTRLIGEGYWWQGIKVIKETYIDGTTPVIVGADYANVISCYIRPTAWGSRMQSVYDNGSPMTVYHCTIDGVLGPSLTGFGFAGASSIIDSEIKNFDGPAGSAGGAWGTGGALISGCKIVNNRAGVGSQASNFEVRNCVIKDITSGAIGAGVRDELTDNVLIFRNHIENVGGIGISFTHVTDSEIFFNTISDAGSDGISLWNYQQPLYHVKVHANGIIRGTSSAVKVIDGQATIVNNTFACNVAGVFVRSDQVIDLRWNEWDHASPTVNNGYGAYDPGCDGFFDICYEALYALTPEPLYLPHRGKGSCIVGVIAVPSPPRAPARR